MKFLMILSMKIPHFMRVLNTIFKGNSGILKDSFGRKLFIIKKNSHNLIVTVAK